MKIVEDFKGIIDTRILAQKTVREIERIDYTVRKAGGSKNAGIDQKEAIAAMVVWKELRKFRYTDNATNLKYEDFQAIANDTRIRFFQQHIANHFARFILLDYYDWLCDKKYVNYKCTGFFRKAEKVFKNYEEAHRSGMEEKTWILFQDHITLLFGRIKPLADIYETAIRDYLIQHRSKLIESGQRDDIPLVQKTAVLFSFLTAMNHSYKDFFSDIIETHGIDFSTDFSYANLHKMILNSVWMCESIGIKFGIDKDNDTVLLGVDIDNAYRVKAAWHNITVTIGDNDTIDETAMQALNYNPESLREYEDEMLRQKVFEEEQKRIELEEGFKQLKEKYNVNR